MGYAMKYKKGKGFPFKSDEKIIVGENTSEIKKDKKGDDYALVIDDSANFSKGDTIRPGNAPRVDNYIMGGDYKTKNKGNKNFEITEDAE